MCVCAPALKAHISKPFYETILWKNENNDLTILTAF